MHFNSGLGFSKHSPRIVRKAQAYGGCINHEQVSKTLLDQALKERNQAAPEKEQAQVTPMPNNPKDIKIEYLTVKPVVVKYLVNEELKRVTTLRVQAIACTSHKALVAKFTLTTVHKMPYTQFLRIGLKYPTLKKGCKYKTHILLRRLIKKSVISSSLRTSFST